MPDRDILDKLIRDYAKHWCYQLEKGDNGLVHWQIQMSLIKKRRGQTLLPILTEAGFKFGHLKPMSNAGRDTIYSIKADTRIEGPWSDKDKKPRYIQKRFRDSCPKQWQAKLEQELIQMQKDENDRNIMIKMDEGNEGKSWFKGYMKMKYDNVIILPASMTDPGQMIEYICSVAEEGGEYIIFMDVPRSTSTKHWFTLAAGLETIKQGMLYDHRYKGKEVIIEPPQICVFCNARPPDEVMTKDVFTWFMTPCAAADASAWAREGGSM